jgi:hypothetical protein
MKAAKLFRLCLWSGLLVVGIYLLLMVCLMNHSFAEWFYGQVAGH